MNTGGVWGGANVTRRRITFPPHEAAPVLERCGALLGVGAAARLDSALGRAALALARERLREGHSVADLVRACELCARRWASGDRWHRLRSFRYAWGASMAEVLAAGDPAPRGSAFAPVHRAGEERAAWEASLAESPQMPDVATLLGRRDMGLG